jgi:hypothetical protein
MDVVYGTRNRLAIKTRKIAYMSLRALSKLQRLARPDTPTHNQLERVAIVLPHDATPTDVGSAVNHVGWYFGARDADECVTTRFALLVPDRLLDIEEAVPSSQRDYRGHAPAIERESLEEATLSDFDALLVWRAADVLGKRFWNVLDRVYPVDSRLFNGAECGHYMKVGRRTVDRRYTEATISQLSRENFSSLCDRWKADVPALALGTGPSLSELEDRDFSEHPVVVCNSIVKNEALLEQLEPAVVCFADPVFHFGPSEYAARFRDDLLRVVKRHDCFVVTRRDSCGILLRHHPELSERLIGLDTNAGQWSVPTSDRMSVRSTANILTLFMVPVAAALSDRIAIGGCDGRKPDEDYFWEHNSSVQYEGLMKTVFETHPSFFRDRVYTDYYDQHCERLEAQLAAFEEQGKVIESMTHSYIPALVSR